MTVETAPKVLVLGALGFVGRNFVQYLVENNLASNIRAVDKALPQTAYLSAANKAAFDHPSVEHMQANLINPGMNKIPLTN
jgi:nucleoside-diphosphate-sugar epimerase